MNKPWKIVHRGDRLAQRCGLVDRVSEEDFPIALYSIAGPFCCGEIAALVPIEGLTTKTPEHRARMISTCEQGYKLAQLLMANRFVDAVELAKEIIKTIEGE